MPQVFQWTKVRDETHPTSASRDGWPTHRESQTGNFPAPSGSSLEGNTQEASHQPQLSARNPVSKAFPEAKVPEGDGEPGLGRDGEEAAPGKKNPCSALLFLPKLERLHFHHHLHAGLFRCTLQRPQMMLGGGRGGHSIFCAFLKRRLGRGPALEGQGPAGSFQEDWLLLQRWLETTTHSIPKSASLVAQLVKNPPAVRETWVRSLGWEDPLEKGKATHSSILAWRIPWTS